MMDGVVDPTLPRPSSEMAMPAAMVGAAPFSLPRLCPPLWKSCVVKFMSVCRALLMLRDLIEFPDAFLRSVSDVLQLSV